jgi:hypothetical protein
MDRDGTRPGRRLTDALLLGIFGLLAAQALAPAPRALAAEAGGNQMFALTAPGQGQGSNVLFVLDPQTQRLGVYEHRVGGRLELVTVRNVGHELGAHYEQWPGKEQKERFSTPPVLEFKPK